MRVATNTASQMFVTVNYGSGTPQEAAAWVAYANGNAALYGTTNDITIGLDSGGYDWRTVGYWARLRTLTAAQNPDNQFDFLALGRAAPLGIKNWEIGNENYGTWERDTNALPNHAYTYVVRGQITSR
jgi:alpha-L-arabinofuranosidase